MDRDAWCATVHGFTKSWTWLSDWTELNWSWICYLLSFTISVSMVSVCLPSDVLLQHLPYYLGFYYLGRGVSLQGCSSKAQPLLLTLGEGYLLTTAVPDLQRGIEKTLHMDITRGSTPKSDWLYSMQPKMEKPYTVSKNKTRSWLWLRSWTPYYQTQT